MIPNECKRLAEVDFPIAVVSKHAAREKSIRHGHPSTLHLWWARRPLAACRAMLMALLLPDPCDPHCPREFKTKARELLPKVQGSPGANDEDLRKALLKFIGDFANWDLSSHPTYLEVGRGLVKAAHPDETPLVVDPFAGGGSIPLEALRLGCEAFASDINPVACLILKVMLEDIPRHGPKLAEELRRVGKEIKAAAEKELGEFYPIDPDGSRPIAYLWARTVRCEAPKCGAEIPLVRSFWLCKKASRKWAVRHRVVRVNGEPPWAEFEVFEPKTENDVPIGTVRLAKATCLCCGAVLPPVRVRAQLAAQSGGADVIFDAHGQRRAGARLLAVVTLNQGAPGRHYRLPTQRDYEVVWNAQQRLANMLNQWERRGKQDLCPVPDEPTPQDGTGGVGGGFRTRKYGLHCFGDFFTVRQKVALLAMARTVRRAAGRESGYDVADALALSLGKVLRHCNVISKWHRGSETVAGAFGMQAIPMSWDFPELYPLVHYAGGLDDGLEDVTEPVGTIALATGTVGQSEIADAAEHPLPEQAAHVWFTDPPYYDSVPYADLSDFFFVLLKRVLSDHRDLRDPFDAENMLTPKVREAVRDEQDHIDARPKKSTEWYEQRMHCAFGEGRRVLLPNGVGSVVFAHKTTEGWEALLSGIIRGGWTITGSWPVATERGARLRARESAALATSVHLVCRPRPEDAGVGDWGDVLRELPVRVAQWMERLQGEGVRGADLVFACIGPALEIYSRYSKVVDAEEREIPLGGDPEASEPHRRGFLAYVWEVVGRTALEQVLGTAEAGARNGLASALEEDARLTALFLWTLQSTNGGKNGNQAEAEAKAEEEDEETEEDQEKTSRKRAKGFNLIFDVVRRFAQPLGIHLPEWEGRIIETEKGVVRLLAITDRAEQLFGKDGAEAVATELERSPERALQLSLFPEMSKGAVPEIRGRRAGRTKAGAAEVSDEALRARREATTLDRVHAAMLLQKSGRANALRALLKAEQDRGTDFLRLANALSALYPRGSEEKRLLDAMLLAVPR